MSERRLLANPLDLVRERLGRHRISSVPCRFDGGTHRAADAAAALGTSAESIAKTVVFRGRHAPVLAVVAGHRRVSRRALEQAAAQRVEPAPGSYLIDTLGVPPGAASPLVAPPTALVVVDASLARAPLVWVAAGTPDTLVALTGTSLVELTAAHVAAISADSSAHPE